ncbi:MAG: winged helix-turn-helix transcriptional regulator [Thermoplasmata archaeon]|nr:winged helix-turn-helix transcriptional regulator [Thermoplasmata archaeon]
MDPLDFAIYRFFSPGGEARFWAGRRVIDPTIPAREIAERVGISENGVRTRIRSLAARGFLRGLAITPNPSLFGARVYVAELPVKEAGEVERILRDLALVEGVIFARDILDEDERKIRVHIVSENEAAIARRVALLRRLAATGPLRLPQAYWIPACERELTPLDWRVLQRLWSHPDATVAEMAGSVGISLKTAARRYHQLVDANAFWWTHGSESEEFPLALVWIFLRGAEDRDSVAGTIRKETPAWMPVAPDGLGLEPGSASTLIAGLVPADAPVVLERLLRKFAGWPGVARVRRTFALGSMAYPAWFADRLNERVRPGFGSARG